MGKAEIYLLFGIVMIVYMGSTIYQLWFTPQKMIERNKRTAAELPEWYPLRKLAISWLQNEKSWLTVNRIMSIFGMAVSILFLALAVYAMSAGK